MKVSIQEIKNEIGPISILVNNAANDERHNIDDVTPEFWDNRMNTNLRHYFFTVQSIYKDMKKIRKKDYCELQEIERYYKDMERERTKLYEKRKKELQKEIKKKEEKLEKEMKNFLKTKPHNEEKPLSQLKCPKTTIQGA